jgi:hypothetical protein
MHMQRRQYQLGKECAGKAILLGESAKAAEVVIVACWNYAKCQQKMMEDATKMLKKAA